MWGFLSGTIIGLSQIMTLLLHQSSELTLSSLQAVMVLPQPEWLGPALLPFFGLLSGILAERFRLRGIVSEKDNRQLKKANQALQKQLDQYERQLGDLSRDRAYSRSWDDTLANQPAAEHLASLLIDSMIQRDRNTGLPDRLFHLLCQARPETLGVFDLKGHLIRANEALLALYGFSPSERAGLRSLDDLLLPDASKRAAAFLLSALSTDGASESGLQIKSTDGGFSKLAIPPIIDLTCTGSPKAIMATMGKQQPRQAVSTLTARALDQNHFPDPDELIRRDFCCLSEDGRITFVSQNLAGRIGRDSDQLLGQRFIRFISHRSTVHFESFLKACHEGNPASARIEMLAPKDCRVFFHFEAIPSIGASGRYLGAAILATDITSETLAKEELSHRLSMEKLISSMSTRFISIRSEELDAEIEQALRLVGDLEEAEESVVEIFASGRIRNPARFSVVNARLSAGRPMTGSGQASVVDRLETVTVPIVIESERLGCFRFHLESYRMSWLESDLELIRLIGEIIINARIRMENEQAIKLNETRLATTLHSIGEAVIATDTQGHILNMNRQAELLTGWNRQNAISKPVDQVFSPVRSPAQPVTGSPDVQNLHHFSETDFSEVLQAADGQRRFISVKRDQIEDPSGNLYGEVIVFRDVTKEKQENDEIRYISYHDKLTGLYNRAFFEEELNRLNTPRQYPITLILGDCNGLKIANDIFGHLEGDRLLQTIANILRSATRHEDIVARWGGDEFAIILPRTDEQAASILRDRILQLCAEAESNPIKPSLALGSATNSDGSSDLVGLLKLAEDRMYRHKLMEGKSARSTILNSIEKMIYEKSCETEEHASRLSEISRRIGREVGLSDYEMEELSLLSVLHDMGKIGIPDNILTKPGSLSDEEWEIMKKHSEKGYNLAKSTPELKSIADSILHHHERWDGNGYPAGLKGEEIPRLSRILSIVDAYDVITHSRAYKPAKSKEAALEEIEKCAGTQFDPELSRLFVQLMKD